MLELRLNASAIRAKKLLNNFQRNYRREDADMKAAVYTTYGPPDVVQITDVEQPVPKADELLIKVRAASVNPLDWRLMSGKPSILRLFFGLRKPRLGRPGVDAAGEVEAVGRNVTQF